VKALHSLDLLKGDGEGTDAAKSASPFSLREKVTKGRMRGKGGRGDYSTTIAEEWLIT